MQMARGKTEHVLGIDRDVYCPSLLPLSWVTIPGTAAVIRGIRLPMGGWWLVWGEVPDNWNLTNLLQFVEKEIAGPVVIRGWPAPAVPLLKRRGWQCWQTGMVGWKRLQHPLRWAKNTRHAIRKGRHTVTIKPLDQTASQIALLHKLENETRRGLPRLQWLFRRPPDPHLRVYAAVGERLWAALAVSTNRSGIIQGEWMVRHPHAPYGVLDAVVDEAIRTEHQRGARIFTFGEVPFRGVSLSADYPRLIMRLTAQGMHRVYNYQGLYRFKNKYVDEWHPVYVCGYPRLTMWAVAGLAHRSRALALWRRGIQSHLEVGAMMLFSWGLWWG